MNEPFVTTFDTVMAALIRGFDGWKMSSGDALRCTDTIFDPSAQSGLRLPILCLTEGPYQNRRWSPWLDVVSWTVQGELLVAVNYADDGGAAIRQALTDVHEATMSIGGLPVDEAGTVVRYSAETAAWLDENKLTFLVDRSGPLLTGGQVVRLPDKAVASVRLSFAVEFYMSLDRRKMHHAQVVALGFTPLDPARLYVARNWAPTSPPEQTTAIGQFNTEGPLAEPSPGETPALDAGAFAPPDPPTLDGADPAVMVQGINVMPYASAVAAPASVQLHAIASFADGHVQDVTAIASWTSASGAVATVAVGLVTGVAAGSTTITASWNGHTSNAAAVTVS